MTQDSTWLSVPELVTILGQPVGRIHRLVEEHRLPGSRRNGPLQVPAAAIRDGEPLPDLKGTLLVLLDLGLTEDEAIDWMLAEDDALGMTPFAAMRVGQKAAVRRAAQLLG
ncbi:helix-turn-helix domain-containing protein [Agrococcus terreus]|uniref:Rv2175c family DNA-binding protein n=1 Tax=Agrococcus terreus TaxID=574649 RepID=UPI00384B3DBF